MRTYRCYCKHGAASQFLPACIRSTSIRCFCTFTDSKLELILIVIWLLYLISYGIKKFICSLRYFLNLLFNNEILPSVDEVLNLTSNTEFLLKLKYCFSKRCEEFCEIDKNDFLLSDFHLRINSPMQNSNFFKKSQSSFDRLNRPEWARLP